MRKQDKDLVLDFFTLSIAAVSQSLFIAAFATMTKPPEITDKVFSELFNYSFFSIAGFYTLFHIVKYLLSLKFPLPDWSSGALWLSAIIFAIFPFSYFAFNSSFFGHFAPSFAFLMVALVPAALFRLPIEIVIYSWRERKGKRKPLSIVK